MLSFGHFYFASLDLYENSTYYPKQTKHLPTNKQTNNPKQKRNREKIIEKHGEAEWILFGLLRVAVSFHLLHSYLMVDNNNHYHYHSSNRDPYTGLHQPANHPHTHTYLCLIIIIVFRYILQWKTLLIFVVAVVLTWSVCIVMMMMVMVMMVVEKTK